MSGGGTASGGKDIKASGLDEIAQGITLSLAELKGLGVDSLAGGAGAFRTWNCPVSSSVTRP